MKFKVALSKLVKRFNWFRHNILTRVEKVKDVIVDHINYIKNNSTEVIEAVNYALDIKENGLA